jgi:hypothetical protein
MPDPFRTIDFTMDGKEITPIVPLLGGLGWTIPGEWMGQNRGGDLHFMDPGRVVWLPGSGMDENGACADAFGGGWYACGDAPWNGGVLVMCCY